MPILQPVNNPSGAGNLFQAALLAGRNESEVRNAVIENENRQRALEGLVHAVTTITGAVQRRQADEQAQSQGLRDYAARRAIDERFRQNRADDKAYAGDQQLDEQIGAVRQQAEALGLDADAYEAAARVDPKRALAAIFKTREQLDKPAMTPYQTAQLDLSQQRLAGTQQRGAQSQNLAERRFGLSQQREQRLGTATPTARARSGAKPTKASASAQRARNLMTYDSPENIAATLATLRKGNASVSDRAQAAELKRDLLEAPGERGDDGAPTFSYGEIGEHLARFEKANKGAKGDKGRIDEEVLEAWRREKADRETAAMRSRDEILLDVADANLPEGDPAVDSIIDFHLGRLGMTFEEFQAAVSAMTTR